MCACCLGGISAWNLARADYLFRKDTPKSVNAALALEPDAWRYALRLSQLDEEHAPVLLEKTLALNPFNAQANIELGLRSEAQGDDAAAERYLLAAYGVDRTYLPRWSLANYYLRHDRRQEFWTWAQRALQMPAEDVSPLFELCWRVSPDAEKMGTILQTENPGVLRQYLLFLVKKNQTPALAPVTVRLLRAGTVVSDRLFLFSIVDRLIVEKSAADALALWHRMEDAHWVDADSSIPRNALFAREPLTVSFDWSLATQAGLHSWPGSTGLETEFTGTEPERCVIAEQVVALRPGSYRLNYSYRTASIPAGTGVRWQLLDAASGVSIAESSDLSSDAEKKDVLLFSVARSQSLLRLRLKYERAVGTPRIAGNLRMISTCIQPQA